MIILLLSVLCVLLPSGYQQDNSNAFDYHYLIQDAKNNNGIEQTLPSTIQTIQGNVYDQTPKKIDSKPCTRRSNSESDTARRQWIPSFSPQASSQISESPELTQSLRTNDLNLKAKSINQDFFTNQPSYEDGTNFQSSRSSILINKTPFDFGKEKYHEPLPTKEEPRLPGFPVNFAPSSAFDLDLTNDFYTAPSQSRNLNPSDVNPKPVSRPEPLLSESEYDFQVRSNKPESESSLSNNNIRKSEPSTKCSDDPDILHSRRSMSSNNDDISYSASDNLNSDKDLSNVNDPYEQSQIGNDKALASILHSEQNLNKDNNDQKEKPVSISDKTKSSTYQSVARSGRAQFNEARREMLEPTRGISNIGQSALVLMQTERICYACSTANNPSCWAPDRRTTVKYCRKGNNACITKTFGSGSTFTLIRDCGRSCDDSDMGGLMPKYKSCSMCHSELCNSAYSINGQSILFALILTAFIKYLN